MKGKRLFGIVATATVVLTAALCLASCEQSEERYVDGLSLKNFKVIPRSCSTLTKWNLSGDLAVDSKKITVA